MNSRFIAAGQSKNRRQGFTLLELLIVLGILGFVSIAGLQMLRSGIGLNQSIHAQSSGLENTVRVWAWIEQDMMQMVARPIRDELGESEPALRLADNHLAFTRSGWENPLNDIRSRLQRIEYQIHDEQLQRRFWQVLDRDQESEHRDQVFSGVEAMSIQVLSSVGWVSEWPPEQEMLPGGDVAPVAFPSAIRIELELIGLGKVSRVFELPSPPVKTEDDNG